MNELHNHAAVTINITQIILIVNTKSQKYIKKPSQKPLSCVLLYLNMIIFYTFYLNAQYHVYFILKLEK